MKKPLFIQAKVKRDWNRWLKQDLIGVFQTESLGCSASIFVNKKTKEILVDDEVIENIASIYEKEGSDCFSDDPQKFLGINIKLMIIKN